MVTFEWDTWYVVYSMWCENSVYSLDKDSDIFTPIFIFQVLNSGQNLERLAKLSIKLQSWGKDKIHTNNTKCWHTQELGIQIGHFLFCNINKQAYML